LEDATLGSVKRGCSAVTASPGMLKLGGAAALDAAPGWSGAAGRRCSARGGVGVGAATGAGGGRFTTFGTGRASSLVAASVVYSMSTGRCVPDAGRDAKPAATPRCSAT